MNSRTTRRFRDCFNRLPADVQERARRAYALWTENPDHPGLQFKRLQTRQAVFSIRIGLDWRALGVLEGDTMIWFWIGNHADYDRLLRGM